VESQSQSDLLQKIHADQEYEILELLAFDGLTNTYRVKIPRTDQTLILREFLHDQFPAGEMVEKYWTKAKNFWQQFDTVYTQTAWSNFPLKLRIACRNNEGIYFLIYEGKTNIAPLKSWFEGKYNTDEYDIKRLIQEILIPLCTNLGKIHDRGIIHRDITNLSLYILEDGKIIPFILCWHSAIEQPKELCFNFPTHIEEAAGTTDDPLGTPGYFAPEVAMLKRITVATDIYSLGVILYYLITGRSRTVEESQEDFQLDIRQIDPTLSPDLTAIIWKATQFEPINRYHSTKEFQEDLQAFLRDQPLIHAPPAPPEKGAEIGMVIETNSEEPFLYLPLELPYMNLEQGNHFRFGRELIATPERPFLEIEPLTESTEQFFLGYSPSKQEFYVFSGHSQKKTSVNGQNLAEGIWIPLKTDDIIGIEDQNIQIRIGNPDRLL
jgi:serine/threonine protein kinase